MWCDGGAFWAGFAPSVAAAEVCSESSLCGLPVLSVAVGVSGSARETSQPGLVFSATTMVFCRFLKSYLRVQ